MQPVSPKRVDSALPSQPPFRFSMAMFWKLGNGTLTAFQSRSPPRVASPSPSSSSSPDQSGTRARPQVSASEPTQLKDEAPSQTSSPLPTQTAENMMHKNDLNNYCQNLGIPFPVYQTSVEGFAHSMRFRSSVSIGEKSFTSPITFANRRSAEQGVAQLALEHLRTVDEARSTLDRDYLRKLVSQDKVRCKMIINEFTAKMKMECTYKTVQAPPVFVSNLVVNGTDYEGEGGRNKKEAEQLAALGAIRALLDDPTYCKAISEVIKSKFNLGASFFECNKNNMLPPTEKEGGDGAVTVSRSSYMHMPITLPASQQNGVRIELVPPAARNAACDSSSLKKRRMN